MVAESRHVTLYGIQIRDPEGYRRYRTEMTPILHRHGGKFGYDFEVNAVLQSEVSAPMNRVFTVAFVDAAAKARFFADEAYRAVKAAHFVPSVERITELAVFDQPPRPSDHYAVPPRLRQTAGIRAVTPT